MTMLHLIGLLLFVGGIGLVRPRGVMQAVGIGMIANGWMAFWPYLEGLAP